MTDLTNQARESMTQQRQQKAHLQENMRDRAGAEVKAASDDTQIQAEARESETKQRQHETHEQALMRERGEEEIRNHQA